VGGRLRQGRRGEARERDRGRRFHEIGAAYYAGSSTISDDGTPVDHRIIRGSDVKIEREMPDSGWWRVTYNGLEWMGEIYKTLAEAEAGARDWCARNPRAAAE
jgi:hypothetical protein